MHGLKKSCLDFAFIEFLKLTRLRILNLRTFILIQLRSYD